MLGRVANRQSPAQFNKTASCGNGKSCEACAAPGRHVSLVWRTEAIIPRRKTRRRSITCEALDAIPTAQAIDFDGAHSRECSSLNRAEHSYLRSSMKQPI